ncbi:MAG: hypothetical protein ACYCPF_13365 [Streptosporangiaceae bacterium]
MATRAAISGLAVSEIAAGLILAWAGTENVPVTTVVRSVFSGHLPAKGPPGHYVTPAGSGTGPGAGSGPLGQEVTTRNLPSGGTPAANAALGRVLAAAYGWATGQDWTALNYGWGTLESGWNQYADNPGSGAFGIAQALGHGGPADQGTYSDAYGPIGSMTFPTSLYVGANSGNPADQIRWGLEYIREQYGSPAAVPGWLGQPGYQGY